MIAFGSIVVGACAVRGPESEISNCSGSGCTVLRSLVLAVCWLVVMAAWLYVHVKLKGDRDGRRDAWLLDPDNADAESREDIASLKFRSGHGMNAAIVAQIFSFFLFCYNFHAFRTDGIGGGKHQKVPDFEEKMLDAESSDDNEDEYNARNRGETVVVFDRRTPVHSPTKESPPALDNREGKYATLA